MKNTLKSVSLGATLIVVVALLSIGAYHAKSEEAHEARVERGRYLADAIGCEHCHAPKILGPEGAVADKSRYLSGHPEGSALPLSPALPDGPWAAVASWDMTAWSGPWGTTFGINLTPDENTGIGSWSEETFIQALKTGRHMGVSRPILPPMPWQNLSLLTDEDLGAIYAFLMSQPPIHNRVPEPLPPATTSVVAGS